MALGRKLLLATIISIPVWVIVAFVVYGPSDQSSHIALTHHAGQDMATEDFWRSVDLKKNDIPEDIQMKAKSIDVTTKAVPVEHGTVFCREALPPDNTNPHITVLLLHGQAFTSETWFKLGTLQMLAAMGYATVAADIPGYGQSPRQSFANRGAFVDHLVKALNLHNPVIVSPSMSGTFALPYLINHWADMGGYVPVAPVGTNVLEEHSCGKGRAPSTDHVYEPLRRLLKPPLPDLSCIKVPTMVVFGEYDQGSNSALLCLLPWSQAAEIPKGKHPAYLTDPDLWHKLLYNFLSHAAKLAATRS